MEFGFRANLAILEQQQIHLFLENRKKAAKARKLFEERPYRHKGELVLEKPLVTVGDVPDRSFLSYFGDKIGADGIIYNNVYDNGYSNN
jgi:hypothetical protein